MYLGRLILSLKDDKTSLPEISEEEQKDFFILIKKLESFYKEKLNATMFNYSCLMNNAYRDNEKPHVHFHFRPRYIKPVEILGLTFSDPNFGGHYISPSLKGVPPVQIPENISDFIIKSIQDYLN